MAKEIKKPSGYTIRPETIVITGTSRLPEQTAAQHVFGTFNIEIEVDPKDNKIVDVSCTLFPFLGEKILFKALLGYDFEEGIKFAEEQIEKRFVSSTKRAVIAALEDAYRWYKKYIEEKK